MDSRRQLPHQCDESRADVFLTERDTRKRLRVAERTNRSGKSAYREKSLR